MSKKKRRQPMTALTQPYLYNLPADLEQVKFVAYGQALDCAYTAIQAGLVLTEEAKRETVSRLCLYHEQLKTDGREGVNDRALFRNTFVEAFMQALPRAEQVIRSGAYAVAPGLSGKERMTLHHDYVKRHLDEFDPGSK